MRLDKYLADCGVGSRSEIKKQIRAGAVRVSGLAAPKPESQINTETAEVFWCGQKLNYQKFIYLMLYKPAGYISATWDAKWPTVLDLVPKEYLHFAPSPVGRLDRDTEGLCLLTNDGQLSHRLLSPAKHVPKTYYAEVRGCVTEEDAAAFLKGVTLDDGYHTKPGELTILSAGAISKVHITITEGKFHQVKRMFLAVGKEVVYLKRIRMNRLCLDPAMQPGDIRVLTEEECRLLEN